MKYGIAIFAAVFVFFGLIATMQSCTIVDSGTVGVRRTFGQVNKDELSPGQHWVNPFFIDRVDEIDTKLKSFKIESNASSKDLQIVRTTISVQHSLTPEMASESYMVIGDLTAFDVAVVTPAVLESLKAVTAQYTAEQLITERHVVAQQISETIQAFIDHTLKNRNIPGALNVANVSINDFNFSPEFNAAIEAKVRTQQEALQAENEKTRRVTQAETAGLEVERAAKAEAFQIEQKSLMQAAAIEREAKALAANPLLLQLRAIEKWNGSVPQFTGGGQAIPFINVEKLANGK